MASDPTFLRDKPVIEALSAMYFNSSFFETDKLQLASPTTLYRVQGVDGRLYARFDEKSFSWTTYPSVTTLIKGAMPVPKPLLDWLRRLPEEESERIANEAAEYGSMLHEFIADMCSTGHISLGDEFDRRISERLSKLRATTGHAPSFRDWAKDLRKGVLSFNQFCIDYEVRVIAVEVALHSDTIGTAGAIDLICMMNDKLYTEKSPRERRKRIGAIVDIKKANPRKDDYSLQLAMYRKLWQHSPYGDHVKIGKLYNWSPSDWTKETPTYQLVDQTDNAESWPLDEWLKFAHHMVRNEPKMEHEIEGPITLGQPFSGTLTKVSTLEKLRRATGL